MTKAMLQVYDPPMCCPSGVCGVEADPELARFAGDLDWLRRQGVEVERFSLSSDPQAFVRQQAVKDTLNKEGNGCLPLIVVNGTIVSKGTYSTRNDLMKLSGIDGKNTESSPEESGNDKSACGPGCACGTPSGGKTLKIAVCLLVVLAVAAIFIYKVVAAKSNGANNTTAKNGAAFALAQPAPSTMPETESQPAAATPNAAKAGQRVGEYLESLSDLNKVAINQDAVFVFIPAPKSDLADNQTNTAVRAAQQTLRRSNITLGLYTLPANSPDYSGISAQVQVPAILVACKGRGMAAVSGDVTETKLLQAFMASSRAGGCGPSGCGPSSGGCN